MPLLNVKSRITLPLTRCREEKTHSDDKLTYKIVDTYADRVEEERLFESRSSTHLTFRRLRFVPVRCVRPTDRQTDRHT
jgi:hypothetical protein